MTIYAKNKNLWEPNLLPRSEKAVARYKNPDNDPKGPWKPITLHAKSGNKSDFEYIFKNGTIWKPIPGTYARFSKETLTQYEKENKIWFGKEGKSIPAVKNYLCEIKQGVTSLTIWTYNEVGHNHEAKTETKAFNQISPFTTPKPERLIERVLTLGSNQGDIVLDSFLGSGTTAAVAQKMGRHYIGIEMGEHAITHVVPRLKKVIDGEQGGISKSLNWHGGGGFTFYDLGEPIFDEEGNINRTIDFKSLAFHIWFSETKTALVNYKKSPLLGIFNNAAYYLLYNGILGDKRISSGNVLTSKILETLLKPDNKIDSRFYRNAKSSDSGSLIKLSSNIKYKKVIYGEACRLGADRLRKENIIFMSFTCVI